MQNQFILAESDDLLPLNHQSQQLYSQQQDDSQLKSENPLRTSQLQQTDSLFSLNSFFSAENRQQQQQQRNPSDDFRQSGSQLNVPTDLQSLHESDLVMDSHQPAANTQHKTLREQEHLIDQLKKENFSLKVKLYHKDRDDPAGLGSSVNGSRDFQPQGSTNSVGNNNSNQRGVAANPNINDTKKQEELLRLQRKIREMEEEMELKKQSEQKLFEVNQVLSQRAVEIEHLCGENESLKLQIKSLEQQQEQLEHLNRSLSYSQQHSQGVQQQQNTSQSQPQQIFNAGRSSSQLSMNQNLPEQSSFHSIIPNTQLEQGINMLRDQISQLKLQLIESTSKGDYLMNELEQKSQNHQRSIRQLYEQFTVDEEKYKRVISQLRNELNLKQNEISHLTSQLDQTVRSKSYEESSQSVEIEKRSRELEQYRARLKSSEAEKDKLMIKVHAVEVECEEKRSLVEQLTRQLENKSRECQDLSNQTMQFQDQSKKVASAQAKQVQDLNALVKMKDAEIAAMKEQIHSLQSKINQLEDGYQTQSKSVQREQEEIRNELNLQIERFKIKSSEQSSELSVLRKEKQQLKQQIEQVLSENDEKMEKVLEEQKLLQQDLSTMLHENESMRKDLKSVESQCNQAKKDKQICEDQMREMKVQMEKYSDQVMEYKSKIDKLKTNLQAKESELNQRITQMQDLNLRLAQLQKHMLSDNEVTKHLEDQYLVAIEEKDKFLIELNSLIDITIAEFDVGAMKRFDSLGVINPSKDFAKFSAQLKSKCDLMNSFTSRLRSDVDGFQSKFQRDIAALYKRLDRKLAQMDKFEGIVQDAVAVQRKLKQKLRESQNECSILKSQVDSGRQKIADLTQKLHTKESDLLIHSTMEKSKFAQIDAQLLDCRNQLRLKENELMLLNDELQQMRESKSRDYKKLQQDSKSAEHELNLSKSELQIKQREIRSLQKLLEEAQKSNYQHSSNQQDIVRLNEELQRDVDRLRQQSMRSQIVANDKNGGTSSADYDRLLKDYQNLKRKLEKREQMIGMALSKLELVNTRRDSVQAAILNQFSDDVRYMMAASTNTTPQTDAANNISNQNRL
ncbi:hypothetical protein MP228_002028 [Amoeboaphelidium protococcarum]|nr:hypothetical protein MP228_002028 [Amoeboaphelidium protococcarum]